MLMKLDLDNDMRSLKSHDIRTHQDALKFYTVRYSSFTAPHYPLDAPIPAFELAKHGFYFEQHTRLVKCSKCSYTSPDLYEDLMLTVLFKHYCASPNCEQVRASNEIILSEGQLESQSNQKNFTIRNLEKENTSSIQRTLFANEESRVKSFESEKLSIGATKLAANGLYRVPKQDVLSFKKDQTASKKILKPSIITTSNDSEIDDTRIEIDPELLNQESQIEAIARSVPTLYHLRCAFCPYECLLFKKSLLNTLYKSPFEEHREKYGTICPIFALHHDTTKNLNLRPGVDLNRDIAYDASKINPKSRTFESNDFTWLEVMFEFESGTAANASTIQAGKSSVLDHILIINSENDLVLRHIPKVIEKIYEVYVKSVLNKKQKQTHMSSAASNNNQQQVNRLNYVPGGSKAIKEMNTVDFNDLQIVLNQSDSVLSRRATHPEYAQYEARLESFKEWPASMSQQPADLAKAGFYYFGIKDMVKCFFCNGGLKNWDQNDDPFQDHVRWFPTCQYIRQLMGHEYVEDMRRKFKDMESGFSEEMHLSTSKSQDMLDIQNREERFNLARGTDSSLSTSSLRSSFGAGSSSAGASSSSTLSSTSTNRSVSPRTLNSRMDSNIVRKIIDNKLLIRDSIKHAIEKKLASPIDNETMRAISASQRNQQQRVSVYNDDYSSPIEMALAAYNFERKGIEKAERLDSLSDFIIFNLNQNVKAGSIFNYIYAKFGIYPLTVRILREHRENELEESRCFCLVTLQQNDRRSVDYILKVLLKSINTELSELKSNQSIVVLRTVWKDIEQRIRPIIDTQIINVAQINIESLEQSSTATAVTEASESSALEPMDTSTSTTTISDSDYSSASSSMGPSMTTATSEEKNNEENPITDEDAMQLKQENERLKNERLCVVCLGREKNVLFLPCAHLTACLECSLSLQNCPMCRSKIQATVRTFT